MNFKNMKRGAFALFGAMFLLLSSVPSFANLEGRWTQHSAAALRQLEKSTQIDRIMEGNRYVYFSVRGALFSRKNKCYTSVHFQNMDPLQIFRYDKSLEWNAENIRPLAQEFELSGSLPVAMNYSPRHSVLVVVYENNSIDFIFDDGTFRSTSIVKDMAVPGSVTPNNITFDPDIPVFYLGGGFGYITIDLNTGEAKDIKKLDKAVSWVGRVGDKMVIFAGSMTYETYATDTYIYPVGQVPSSLADPKGQANLQWLMPLSDNTFAAMARGSSDAQNVLKLYTIDEDNLEEEELIATLTVDDGANVYNRHKFRTDGYVGETKDGFMVNCNAAIYLLNRKADRENLLSTITKPSTLTANEKASKAATFDGSKVWLYTYENNGIGQSAGPRGFYSYNIDGASWTGKSEIAAPNAPLSMLSSYIAYHPEYGMLIRAINTTLDQGLDDTDRLCSYAGGKWTDRTCVTVNDKYNTLTHAAENICIDPIDNNKIWGNSLKRGFHRLDLSDPSNFLAIGNVGNKNKYPNYPNYYPVLPDLWYKPEYAAFSNVAFDNDSVMWFTIFTESDKANNDITYANLNVIPLYYLTAEERRQLDDPTAVTGVLNRMLGRVINLKKLINYEHPKLLAMTGEKNKNVLVGGSFAWFGNIRRTFIFDHNGTPDNQEDDRLAVIWDLYDERGEKLNYYYEDTLLEDPVSGDLIYATNRGVYLIDPQELLAGGKSCRRLSTVSESGQVNYPLEQTEVKGITIDNLGRKWFGATDGLYCISADGKKLLGHYTTENSRIPSNYLLNVGCNLETGAIWVLSDRGIAEFLPEGSVVTVKDGNHLAVWPSAVTPDYNGFVTASDADTVSEYAVYDQAGEMVCDLGKSDLGRLQWDMKDASGERVQPGRYNIKRKNTDERHPLVVM